MFRFRDKEMAGKIVQKLREMDLQITLMHVCGTHQDTLVRHGLQPLLEDVGVDIRQGPGCPVCVTTAKEIEESIALAKAGKTITVFGDMIKVPGVEESLSDAKTEGHDVRIVYGVNDAVELAAKISNEVVFIGVGFETTTPSIAVAVSRRPPKNFSLLSCHRVIPPALKAIVEMGEVRLDGLIEPGHVSTIIGSRPYEFLSEEHGIPQVIAGFEPLDLLMGVYMLAKQKEEGNARVDIEYRRVVKPEGNPAAIKVMNEVFEPADIKWRGFPTIPGSGLVLSDEYQEYDARQRFEDDLAELKGKEFKEPKGCRCGEVLRGIIRSQECPLFAKTCTPANPIGPCMVSAEGSCNILYKYSKYAEAE
ncbi:MAG: hydrogenase formation protein HypD [Thermoplasmata archaeon]|nr:hydrogenase formation protein HypD [Thermoplasmata archaeon]